MNLRERMHAWWPRGTPVTSTQTRIKHRVLLRVLVCVVIFVLGVFYGATTVFHHLRPIGLLSRLDRLVWELPAPTGSEARYLAWAFQDPLPEGPLLNPPVRNLASLEDQLGRLSIIPNDAFFNAYQTIEVGRLVSLGGDLVELEYSAGKKAAKAYAYLRKPPTESRCGVLVIPESGDNKSHPLASANAFGIAEVCSTFVLIKPNEDYRAIHDGEHKLRDEMYVVGLLRRGVSQSVTYLVEALAFEKYIDNQFEIAGVAGLSQGGEAAFLTSLQSRPDFAVIASGFSAIQWQVTMAEMDQIIIPGLYNVYTLEHLKGELSSSRTHYLFTFGAHESLYYGMDATTRRSCEFLDSIGSQHVSCVVHDGAHEVPAEVVLPFISAHAAAPAPGSR